MLRIARGIASKLYLRLPQSAIQKIIAALRGALLEDFCDRQVSDVASPGRSVHIIATEKSPFFYEAVICS
ncbi:MAG: hypothetical protein AUH08_00455 [Verrucomicrobia bacterium 13_2_20CM_54_12]|nr:MAG: hypothetical protein AUH08_00455 [Verrucomicrobia bacterium 13_2_20CM_54_12]OLD72829.1 MAG: hypothetical protein AUF68_05630 [Verrucomicrobia bacterium 13_1_20CM_54_28]